MSTVANNRIIIDQSYLGHSQSAKRRRRILVVEDQVLLAAVIADLLGDTNDVLCAHGVEEALDHLLCDTVDLVLLDCILPDGPNWQIALEADRQDIAVVLMTGDAEQTKELVAGSRPYLLKPFTLASLIDMVDKVA
jgi:DNA-binding response OmpR family regulator